LRVRGSPHPLEFIGDETRSFVLAAENKALRIHSDLLLRDLEIAACISVASSEDNRACIKVPRSFDFGTLGLPIFDFIKIKFNLFVFWYLLIPESGIR